MDITQTYYVERFVAVTSQPSSASAKLYLSTTPVQVLAAPATPSVNPA